MQNEIIFKAKEILNICLKVIIIGLFVNAIPFALSGFGDLFGTWLGNQVGNLTWYKVTVVFFESVGWLAIPLLFYAFHDIFDKYLDDLKDEIWSSLIYLIIFTIVFFVLFSINVVGAI